MCSKNQQYTLKLCRSGILTAIKSILHQGNRNIIERALKLLSFIIKEFVGPMKAFTKVDQCENTIRQSLVGNDFIPKIVSILVNPESNESLLRYAFGCLSEYTCEITIPSIDRRRILITINRIINTTVCIHYPH